MPAHGCRGGHRRGDDRRAGLRRGRRGPACGLVLPGVPAALPPARLGRARRRRHLERGPGDPGRIGLGPRAAGHADRRHRHHRPARDRRRLGAGAPGRPLHRAIVWQDRRTAARCDELRDAGHLPLVRDTTGLVLDPYFSATKLEWLLGEGGVDPADPDLAFGTVDSWVLWNLTGGAVHATDPSNASRTMLYDIRSRAWSRRAVRPVRRPRVVPARGAPVERPLRDDGPIHWHRGHPGQRHRRRPAGRAVRPGLLHAGHDQEHLRHRLLRAHERRRRLPRAGRGPAHDRGLGAGRRHRRLRARGRHLRDRRRDAVAARRARHHRRCRRDRAAGRVDRPTPRASTSSPRSPASAARGGTRTRAARSSA